MKIKQVARNNRKKCFIIETTKGAFEYPYSSLEIRPSEKNPITGVGIDSEIGDEGFTITHSSGKIETVHIEQVLEWNRDPEYLCDLLLHQLTVRALKALGRVKIPHRELARRLRTSPKQISRLLDPAFYGKSINQMVKLLYVLGEKVEISTKREAA